MNKELMEQIRKKAQEKPRRYFRVGSHNGKQVFLRRPDLPEWYLKAKQEQIRRNKWWNRWKHVVRVRAVNDLTLGMIFGIRPKNRGPHRR